MSINFLLNSRTSLDIACLYFIVYANFTHMSLLVFFHYHYKTLISLSRATLANSFYKYIAF